MLTTSDNLMAELILLALARKVAPEAATLAEAAAALARWWRARLPPALRDGIVLSNGSGLSEVNRLTPRAALRVLASTERLTPGGRPFHALLPIAGWSGTLASRLTTPELALGAWAKTGTLDYAVGISGQLVRRDGGLSRFALFVGNPELRRLAKQAQRSAAAAAALERRADAWTGRARALMDELLRSWSVDNPSRS
jgi:D-alanyl-D-alanine carboxypeptidase/D-alanyl-D-alanine-endopeptidase (penicillin-binding protein 4)